MDKRKSPTQLAKFIYYILGRRPDEFGLVPDTDGFVKIKELIKAICEEEGLRYVRRFHIDEILITLPVSPIEISDKLVRAKSREHLPERIPAPNLPKLLYTCIRRKAYPFVMDKGIFPIGRGHVILSSEKKLAEKMGKRIDQTPVLLTVQTQKSGNNGVIFFQAGDLLFIANTIPVGCFTGPPLPKEKPEVKKEDILKKEKPKSLPGTFLMDLTDEKDRKKRSKHERRRKEIAWKKERKKMKRKKENIWDI
ncbi:MAG: RNA 2'-phosphotransferase [Deltaproteobacteria bacterium]|nr:RNA 2'-phosphotransferase [Deltaproteobacteria bacterium]MBW2563017.1 RNA 2'-phosphotransferase [Deltaproteobacteria bacterium]